MLGITKHFVFTDDFISSFNLLVFSGRPRVPLSRVYVMINAYLLTRYEYMPIQVKDCRNLVQIEFSP